MFVRQTPSSVARRLPLASSLSLNLAWPSKKTVAHHGKSKKKTDTATTTPPAAGPLRLQRRPPQLGPPLLWLRSLAIPSWRPPLLWRRWSQRTETRSGTTTRCGTGRSSSLHRIRRCTRGGRKMGKKAAHRVDEQDEDHPRSRWLQNHCVALSSRSHRLKPFSSRPDLGSWLVAVGACTAAADGSVSEVDDAA